jgi:hypothetical protein
VCAPDFRRSSYGKRPKFRVHNLSNIPSEEDCCGQNVDYFQVERDLHKFHKFREQVDATEARFYWLELGTSFNTRDENLNSLEEI